VPDDARSPMSATIYIEMADGSARIFKTAASGWKSRARCRGELAGDQFRRFAVERCDYVRATGGIV